MEVTITLDDVDSVHVEGNTLKLVTPEYVHTVNYPTAEKASEAHASLMAQRKPAVSKGRRHTR